MTTIDLTAIILALITMVSGWVGWWLDRRRHRQEVEGLKADNRMKDLELAEKYVNDFIETIADPLRKDVRNLKDEVNRLKDAIEKVNDCPYRDNCPVRPTGVRKQQENSGE